MRYRIKIIGFKNGRQEFIPQARKRRTWVGIAHDGEAMTKLFESKCSTRDEALDYIDLSVGGNADIKTIEFEYIIK